MGGKQLGFTDYELITAKKQTKREKFLSEMEAVVPWQALIDLIEPHYPKASKNGGRPPYPLATMLRIHLLQQWYSLSDPAMEEAQIEVPTGLTQLVSQLAVQLPATNAPCQAAEPWMEERAEYPATPRSMTSLQSSMSSRLSNCARCSVTTRLIAASSPLPSRRRRSELLEALNQIQTMGL